jgi:hypothetical protein
MGASATKRRRRANHANPSALPSDPVVMHLARVAIQRAKMKQLAEQTCKQEASVDNR